MSHETAQLVFYSVTTTMLVVWLAGVRFCFSRLRPPPREGDDSRLDSDPVVEQPVARGEAVASGDPETVSKKLAEILLAQGGVSATFLLRIKERTAERILIDVVSARAREGAPPLHSVDIVLEPQGDRVRIRYELRMGRLRSILRTVSWLVCFLYGGLFVFGVPILIWYLCLHSDDEMIRGQTLQILQMVHGVWPPYLIGFVWSRMQRGVARNFETVFSNLHNLL